MFFVSFYSKDAPIRHLRILSFLSFTLLLIIVWALPTAFSACSIDSLWCSISYWATESAGKVGTLILLAITCFFYALRIKSKRKKVIVFFRTFLVIGILLTAIAYANEHFTKEALAIARPSHLFITQHTPLVRIDSIYRLNKEERTNAFQKLVENDSISYKNIDPRILDHWIEESGYSFPSGHSFNAFLLATILTFSMHRSERKIAQTFYWIPFVWAILVAVSRVAVGAHSALDVSFGASLGLLAGHLFLYIDFTRTIITNRHEV